MTPSNLDANYGNLFIWHISSTGSIANTNTSATTGIRPVINLKAGTYYKSGSGTEADPYTVSYNDGTKSVSE